MQQMIIIRGVSGSGKTTLAYTLVKGLENGVIIEADDYFLYESGKYNFDKSRLFNAHCNARFRTEVALAAGQSVIISNTNTTEKEMAPYIKMAEAFGVPYTVIVLEKRHGNSNVHNVPDETITAQAFRLSNSIKVM